MTHRPLYFLSALSLILVSSSARAQTRDGAVQGRGTAEIKKSPELIRLHADVRAKGKTLPEALAKWKTRCDAVRAALAASGATKGSIQFGDPTLAPPPPMQPEHGDPFIPASPGPSVAPPVVVMAVVQAEWPLGEFDADDFLVKFHDLREKVFGELLDKKAVADAADLEKPCHCACKPGTPVLMLVSKVSEEERAALLARAFDDAKAAARRLARAAGSDLGGLHTLGSELPLGIEPPLGMMFGETPAATLGNPSSSEAIGFTPERITVRFAVSAVFKLKTSTSSSQR